MAAGTDSRRNSMTSAEWTRPGLGGASNRQACSTCRYRKTRCDRAEPKCGRCTRLRLSCDYSVPSRSNREDVPRQLMELQDRLARAEARLAQGQGQGQGQGQPAPPTTNASQPQALSSSMTVDLASPLLDASRQIQPTSFLPVLVSHLNNGTQSPSVDDILMSGFCPEDYDQFFPERTDNGSALGLGPMSIPNSNQESPLGLGLDLAASTGAESASGFAGGFSSEEGEDKDISPEVLVNLHRNYFDVVYFSFPFLSEQRFTEALATNPESRPLLALSYAVALIGCTLSPTYKHLRQTCYGMARQYVELCERDEEESNIASLDLFQALLFIIRHEINSKRLTRAFLTVGRAIRLSRILGLHRIDRQMDSGSRSDVAPDVALPPTQDQAILEERRRSFWALYILESYVSTRTGMPCELGEATAFEVRLPSPGLLASALAPAQMPFLKEVVRGQLEGSSTADVSSYAGCVLMVELALRCFDHGRKLELESEGFWDNHYALIKAMDKRTALMQAHLNAKSVREDPVAFSLHMNLCAADIFFHEAAIKKVELQGLSKQMASESQKRSAAAAFKIASAVRLNWPSQGLTSDIFKLQATFIAWPLSMAAGSLSRDLASSDPKEAASMGVANSLRLLLSAMDQIEEPGGHWHCLTAGAAKRLQQWDEKSGFESEAL